MPLDPRLPRPAGEHLPFRIGKEPEIVERVDGLVVEGGVAVRRPDQDAGAVAVHDERAGPVRAALALDAHAGEDGVEAGLEVGDLCIGCRGGSGCLAALANDPARQPCDLFPLHEPIENGATALARGDEGPHLAVHDLHQHAHALKRAADALVSKCAIRRGVDFHPLLAAHAPADDAVPAVQVDPRPAHDRLLHLFRRHSDRFDANAQVLQRVIQP